MWKLFPLIYILAGPTLAGIPMIVALAAGMSRQTMITLAIIGFIVAIPVAWYVAKVIVEKTGWGNPKSA